MRRQNRNILSKRVFSAGLFCCMAVHCTGASIFLVTQFIFNLFAWQHSGLFLIHWPFVRLKAPPLDPHAGLELNSAKKQFY